MGEVAGNPASIVGNRLSLQAVTEVLPREVQTSYSGHDTFPLPDAPVGSTVFMSHNNLSGLLKQRLVDLGFTPGVALRLMRKGPKENLIAVAIRDTTIALRSEEARSLLVTPVPERRQATRD